MEIDNMFAKFENNKAVHVVGILLPEDNIADWVVIDDSLINSSRIIRDSLGAIRAATEEEIAEELAELKVISTARKLKFQRDQALATSDSLVTPDRWASFTTAQKDTITTYRQALRDLPTLPGFPLETSLPLAPTL